MGGWRGGNLERSSSTAMKPSRRPLIGVMGAGEEASWADQRLAEDLGAAIARRGWGLLSGGRSAGVMGAGEIGGGDVFLGVYDFWCAATLDVVWCFAGS